MTDGTAGRALRPAVPVVTTHDQLREVADHYSGCEEFVIDVETVGPHRVDPRRNEVLWVGLACPGRTDVIPLGHPNGELDEIKLAVLPSGAARIQAGLGLRKADVSRALAKQRKVWTAPPAQLSPGDVFSALEPVLYGEGRKVGANIKFDLESVSKYYGGRIPTPPYGDVIMADFLLDDTRVNYALATICKRRLGYEMPKGVGKEVEAHSFQDVARYLHGDVRFTWLLWQMLRADVGAAGLSSVMNLEMDCAEALMHMEQHGTLIDVAAMEALRGELDRGLTEATASAYRAAGQKFNINSPEDKRRLLFTPEGRNLTPMVLTDKTGQPATSEAALAHHKGDPLVDALDEISDLKKMLSTYVIPYLGGDVERTTAGKTKTTYRESMLVKGRIHTSFKQHGARTGRMSSSAPNLQNIPSKGTYGERIRSMFVADPGHVMVCADFCQIEPRIMASFSGDQVMIDTFVQGRDIYQAIADQLDVDRKSGKVLILAMAYGIGPRKIANDLGLGIQRARELLDEFGEEFRALSEYKKQVVRTARSRNPCYVTTVLGRRRLIPDLRSSQEDLRARGERQAFNSRIQGSAADVMKLAIIRAHRMLPEGSRLLLTVHDELLVLSPEEQAEETREALRTAMEGVSIPQIKVPLETEIGIGSSWAEAKA